MNSKFQRPVGAKNTRKGKNNPLYARWSRMKQWVSDEANSSYQKYGAVGIDMVDEWFDNYKNFLLWSINNNYKKGMNLMRHDESKDFGPTNCYYI